MHGNERNTNKLNKFKLSKEYFWFSRFVFGSHFMIGSSGILETANSVASEFKKNEFYYSCHSHYMREPN